jgi:hypothetical protein
MGRMRWAFALALVFAACGGPLDRRDGALRIELTGVPDNTNAFDVSIRAGGRNVAARVPRHPGDIIDEFSAVPIGSATLDIYALNGNTRLASKLAVQVEVLEDQTLTIPIELAPGPKVKVISPDDNARVLLSSRSIAVVVEADDPTLPTDLSISIGERALQVTSEGHRWSAFIDARAEVPIPPQTIVIDIAACARGDTTACTREMRTIHVERTQWMAPAASPVTARPSLSEDGQTIVYGESMGMLHVASATTGRDRYPPIALDPPLSLPTTIADNLAIAVDGRGVMHAFRVDRGAESWRVSLGDSRPTKPIFDISTGVSRVLIGAKTRSTRWRLRPVRSGASPTCPASSMPRRTPIRSA